MPSPLTSPTCKSKLKAGGYLDELIFRELLRCQNLCTKFKVNKIYFLDKDAVYQSHLAVA